MEIRQQTSMRFYWKIDELLYCPYISQRMNKNRFESISRCLHLVDPTKIMIDKGSLNYDKLAKVSWLITDFRSRCKSLWNCDNFVTIDEMMILYKGRYYSMQ